ncbi:MAG: SDR family NAD(P)-dependent oxidoreductase, partial [Gemmatimonadetes bacterium]|nr:SDR family NAD(P)-dependent oxidoreductase [Gemmatimonadota bacterium]
MSATGRLAEKRAVVTGAGSGIGRAIALRLAQEGAHVAAVDIDRDSAEATADRIRDGGGTAAALTVDLVQVDRIVPMIDEAVSALGGLDILVNNAGRVEIKPFLDLTEMEWDQVIDLNLKGTYFCMQAGARQMIRQGGG